MAADTSDGDVPRVTLPRDFSPDSIGTCSIDPEMGLDLEHQCVPNAVDCPSTRALKSVDLDAASGSRLASRTGSVELLRDSSEQVWRPSYVSLSCAVSGYTDLTRYNSAFRRDLTSAWNCDHPPHLVVLPLQSSNHLCRTMLLSPLKVREVQQKKPPASSSNSATSNEHFITSASLVSPSSGRKPRTPSMVNGAANGRSVSVDRASASSMNSSSSRRVFLITESSSTVAGGSSVTSVYSSESRTVHLTNGHHNGHHMNGDAVSSEHSLEVSRSSLSPGKSFIQQRIERLYGSTAADQMIWKSPGGPRSSPDKENRRPSPPTSSAASPAASPNPLATPPVFRHLRPEFREQLPVAPKRSPSTDPATPSTLNSSTTPSATLVRQLITSSPSKFSSPAAHRQAPPSSPTRTKFTPVLSPSDLRPISPAPSAGPPPKTQPTPSSLLPLSSSSSSLSTASNSSTQPQKTSSPSVEAKIPKLREEQQETKAASQSKDGNYWLQVVKEERARIQQLVQVAEADLKQNNSATVIGERGCGTLRAAIGKAGLLTTKKFKQFEGLCHKNLNPPADEPPVTEQDLQGFWELVSIQVEDIHDSFKAIQTLRDNQWKDTPKPVTPAGAGAGMRTSGKASSASNLPKASSGKTPRPKSASTSNLRNDEQRRKQLAEAKRRMKLQQQAKSSEAKKGEESVEIFANSSTTAHPSRDEQWIGSIKSFDEIPGPKRFPLIGSLWVYNSLVGKYSLSRLHETHRLLRAAYGDIVREDLAGTNVLILFNIQDIEKMFRLEGKYPERRSHTALLKYRLDRPQYYNNGGLLPTNGPTWWKLRAPLQKPLSRVQCVRAHLSDVQSVAFSLIDLIEQLRDSDGQVPDLQSWLARAALETAGCVVMERRLGCLNQNLSADSMPQRLMDASFKSLECIIKTDFSFPWWKWFPTQSYKELDVVRRKTAFLENHGPSDPPSLLESWLSTAELDEKDVIAMVSDFLFASVDTTSFSFSYLLYLLSSNSTVQEKARAEALSLTMPITATALARGIPYLKATVKESMRLFPISVGIGRITTQDLVLSGYRIPTGVST
ncbi:unnamed protein product [Cyprideis torosa]|uniref:Uncharacterized protein n=1 Tax=Cyprideis torosa TaxID=163714 RepID=A0A7R8ZNA0_9CRUS|nr:unnamed protein product [Cyprideis torosa]CAG0885899.1 unnamed protein product [Cyprideis torosa]